MEQDTRIYQNTRTASRVVDGRAVIVVVDDNKLHTLNVTGTELWERCTGASVRELSDWLASRYSLEAVQARRDVEAFVEALRAAGALECRRA